MALGQSDIKRGTRAPITNLPGAQVDCCPSCGGRLEFRKESTGYGTVLEYCEHFDARPNRGCKHWRIVGRRPRPELARAPRGEESRSAQAIARDRAHGVKRTGNYPTGPRGKTQQDLERLLALLPAVPERALTTQEIAKRLKVAEHKVKHLLGYAPEVQSRPRPRQGRYGRPAIEFWRAA